VTVAADTAGVDLRLGPVAGDWATWTRRLPAVYEPRLHVDAASRRWAVVGYEPEGGGVVRYAGTLGDTAVRAERWALVPSGLAVLFADAPPMVVAPRRPPARGMLGTFVSMTLHRWEGWRPDASAPTWLGGFPSAPVCGDTPSATVAVCRVFERTGASLWRVAPAEGPAGVAAIGWVPSAEHPRHELLDATLLPDGRALVVTATGFDVVDPRASRGSRLRVAGGTGGPRGVVATAAGVMLLAEHDGGVEVRRYAGRW